MHTLGTALSISPIHLECSSIPVSTEAQVVASVVTTTGFRWRNTSVEALSMALDSSRLTRSSITINNMGYLRSNHTLSALRTGSQAEAVGVAAAHLVPSMSILGRATCW